MHRYLQVVPAGLQDAGRGVLGPGRGGGLLEEVEWDSLLPGKHGRGQREVQRRQQREAAQRGASHHTLEQVSLALDRHRDSNH